VSKGFFSCKTGKEKVKQTKGKSVLQFIKKGHEKKRREQIEKGGVNGETLALSKRQEKKEKLSNREKKAKKTNKIKEQREQEVYANKM